MKLEKSHSFALKYYLVLPFLFLIAAGALAQQNPTVPSPSTSPSSNNSAGATPAAAPHKAVLMPYEKPDPAFDPKTRLPLYETIQEDWSSLQIGASHLHPETPLVAEVGDKPDFTRALVQVKWRPGDPLDLWVVLPKGVDKPPVVLYLYNFTEDTDRFRDDGWCRRATNGGVAAVGFVSALSGPRFHDRPMRQWFVSELQESLGSTVHDVRFILDYLASRGDMDMKRVGIFGEGSGGAIALLAAAADPRIRAVDSIDPWGDWPDFLKLSPVLTMDSEREQYTKPEFLQKVAPLDPVKWLPGLKVPVRILQLKTNLAVPMESKEKIASVMPKQAELVRFETLADLARHEGKGEIFIWVKQKVQAAGAPGRKSNALKASAAGGKTAQPGGAEGQTSQP